MRKDENIRAYADKDSSIVNKIRLYSDDTYLERVAVRKIIDTLPNKYEVTISSIENSKRDISEFPLIDLISAFYALEQRLANREEDGIEGAMMAKSKDNSKGKK